MGEIFMRNGALGAIAIVGAFITVLIYATTVGIRVGRRRSAGDHGAEAGSSSGIASVEAAVFGLFGLLLAFTFSAAANRLHERKELIRAESQAIMGAWSQLELLSEPERGQLRASFRAYVDQRVQAHARETLKEREDGIAEGERMAADIIAAAAAACKHAEVSSAAEVIMPAVTEMNAASLARKAAIRNHPPAAIFVLLLALSIGVAFMIGLSMAPDRQKGWIHIIAFALTVGTTLYLTLDMELPRLGLIRLDDTDHLMHEVRAAMGE